MFYGASGGYAVALHFSGTNAPCLTPGILAGSEQPHKTSLNRVCLINFLSDICQREGAIPYFLTGL